MDKHIEYIGRWLSVFEALLRLHSTVSEAFFEAQNNHIDLVGNIGSSRLSPPFYKTRPPLVGFNVQIRAQNMREVLPRLLGPRMYPCLYLKTH
jgi:hypothetical protein